MRLPCLLLLLSCLAAACIDKQEGCLDIDAVNFDFTADQACPDCCQFPVLKIAALHQLVPADQPDTVLPFRYDTPYAQPLDTARKVVFKRIRFVLSGFEIQRPDGQWVGVRDSAAFALLDGETFRTADDFVILDRDRFQAATAGTLLFSGLAKAVRFRVGLPEPLLQLDPDALPDDHLLHPENDTLLYSDSLGYRPLRLDFALDTAATAPVRSLTIRQPVPVELQLPLPVQIDRGFDVRLTLQLDYMAWFQGLDFEGDPAPFLSGVVQNLPSGFSVFELKTE